jgi:hypothetical protein
MNRTPPAGLVAAALTFIPITHAAAPDPAPSRETTMVRLARRVSIDITARPLRDALSIVEQLSGLRFQPLWLNDKHADGLDPNMEVSVRADNESVLILIERLIEAADMSGASTWQLAASGTVQLGPRSRLNAFKRLHIYDVSDLLKSVPNHRRGPSIDLRQALQSGSNGAPITGTDDGADWLEQAPRPIDSANELADLIRNVVETDQWKENGGEGGWIQVHQNSLIINAADYMHRAIRAPRPR